MRRNKKDEQRLAQKFHAYSQEEQKFKMQDWSVFPRSTFLQTQYYLTKQRKLLELEKARLDQIKLSLQNKQNELETLCKPHEAKRKIEQIAAGILRKNFRFVRQLEEIETHATELIPRINHAKEQMNALEEGITCDKINTHYRVTCSDILQTVRRRPSSPMLFSLPRKLFNLSLVLVATTSKWMRIGK